MLERGCNHILGHSARGRRESHERLVSHERHAMMLFGEYMHFSGKQVEEKGWMQHRKALVVVVRLDSERAGVERVNGPKILIGG